MPRTASVASTPRRRAPPPPLPVDAPPPVRARPNGTRNQPPALAGLAAARDTTMPAGRAKSARQPPSLQALATAKLLASNSARPAPPPLDGVQRRRAPPPPLEALQRSRSASSLTSSHGVEIVQNPLSHGWEGGGQSQMPADIESPGDTSSRPRRQSVASTESDADAPPWQLTAKQLRDGGRKMRKDAYEACFDSFDLDNSDSLSTAELGLAFEQLGLVMSPADLEALKDKYDEDGDDSLGKREFLRMVDDFMESAPQTFSADDWCPAAICCCSLDCIKWGHRST